MPSLIPRKIRRYKREHPYSYPLLFMMLAVTESLVKVAALVVVLGAGYFLLKNAMISDRPTGTTRVSHTRELPVAAPKQDYIASTQHTQDSPGDTQIPAPLPAPPSALTTGKSAIVEPALVEPSVETTAETQSPPGPEITKDQSGIDWIRDLNPTDFIIQFAATPNEEAIVEFARESLASGAVVYPFKRTTSGRPVYGVSSKAVFQSLESAQQAINEMPESLQQSAPWIRPASQLQRAVASTLE